MAAPRFGRASAAAAAVETRPRAVVYTRKSTTEGLNREFSSLDNQRERGKAYAVSQDWSLIDTRYDDGGFSGKTTDRPALQRLLADAENRLFDVIIVYKLDRLSRSLCDFVNLHRVLEKRGVEIVSVTEPIDTRTPMGRAFVNILVSFGQMEREQTAERTRDKVSAARRQGKYVGGYLVLGYDRTPEGGHLVVNSDEAEMVREIFRLYLANRSLVATVAELDRRHWTLKRWKTREGKDHGGGRFDVHSLRRMLGNHIYEGRVLFEGKLYDGEHDAIISPKAFREVQQVLDTRRRDTRPGVANKYGCLLRGLLFCSCGSPMTHTPTTKGSRLFRYYRCAASMRRGAATCATRTVPAIPIEDFVVAQVRRIGTDTQLQRETFEQALAQIAAERRAARVEVRRLKRDLAAGKQEVALLVDTLSRTDGAAADAVQDQLATAQDRVGAIETRLAEVLATVETPAAQNVDEANVARALQDFEGVWSALILAERERLLHLLISAVRYDGANGTLAIDWRMEGFGALAADVTGG